LTPAIELRGVRKTFGPKVAVTGIDLRIETGSVVAFLGPNGAGKTTTIRMIMSILFPDSGQISVLGKASAVESKDRIGYLPEERGLYRKMKVGAFLTYMCRLKGLPESSIAPRVAEWLDRVGLSDCSKKKCEELSKGMQQKVGFVASVIHEPELIILDEPFSGLDPVNARLLRELIDEQHRKGRTIIFSTHVMAHAEALCDHVVMINRGDKVLDEPMRIIRSNFDPRTVLLEPVTSGDPARQAAEHAQQGAAIREVPGVLEVQPPKLGQPAFSISLADNADPQEAIRRLVFALPVRRVELKRVRLEDVFVRLVGQTGGTGEEGSPGELATAGSGPLEGE
jgi:ABC-2 type transport system ATP-binding protein